MCRPEGWGCYCRVLSVIFFFQLGNLPLPAQFPKSWVCFSRTYEILWFKTPSPVTGLTVVAVRRQSSCESSWRTLHSEFCCLDGEILGHRLTDSLTVGMRTLTLRLEKVQFLWRGPNFQLLKDSLVWGLCSWHRSLSRPCELACGYGSHMVAYPEFSLRKPVFL